MLELNPDVGEISLLKFKDFVPERISKPSAWTGRAHYESLGKVLGDINQWMIRHPGIDIVNVETVSLPNIHEKNEEGSEDTELVSLSGAFKWHQFFRVWYIDGKSTAA